MSNSNQCGVKANHYLVFLEMPNEKAITKRTWRSRVENLNFNLIRA